jgi:hypothetical protein
VTSNRPPCGNLTPHDQHPLNGGVDFADQGWCPGVPNLAEPAAPRVWSAPPEPGPEVTAVTDRNGQQWKRHDGGWCFVGPQLGHHHWRWSELFFRQAPLTDATPAEEASR